MEHESDGDTNCNWRAWYSLERMGTGTGGLGKKWTSSDHPNYSILEIGQNTKKSPRDLRILTITQTSGENISLRRSEKLLNESNNNNNNLLLMDEQFYSTHRWDANKHYQSGNTVILQVIAMKGYTAFLRYL